MKKSVLLLTLLLKRKEPHRFTVEIASPKFQLCLFGFPVLYTGMRLPFGPQAVRQAPRLLPEGKEDLPPPLLMGEAEESRAGHGTSQNGERQKMKTFLFHFVFKKATK